MNEQQICMETLAATLREPEVLNGNIERFIYVTGRPLGSEGSTGVIQMGDLSSDPLAKIIRFDRQQDAFSIASNGNPPPPEEYIPDGDIGGVIRHIVRGNSAFGRVFVTITDTITGRGIETIRKVIAGEQVELYCQHGPHPTARGVSAFVRNDDFVEPAISWTVIGCCLLALAAAYAIYRRFIYKPPPPDDLPDVRPYVIAQRHGVRKLRAGDDQDELDVKSALSKIRGE